MDTTVQVRIRVFGGLTDVLGAARISLELPEGADVALLRATLAAEHPSLAPLLARTSVALDLEVASDAHRLTADSEVALLPPVAGGADGPRVVTGLQQPPFDVAAITTQVSGPATGGTAVFLGTVRDHAPDLGAVQRLDYSAYESMAEKVLATIAEELVAEWPELTGVALLHAVGELAVGEHTVLIVCSAAHRHAAFEACRAGLEAVKDRVPVFKREMAADGTHRWVGLPDPEGGDS